MNTNNNPENSKADELEKIEMQQEQQEPTQEVDTPKEERPPTPDQELYRKGLSQGFKLAKRDPKLAEEIRNEMSTGHLLQAGFMKGIKSQLTRAEAERLEQLKNTREGKEQTKTNER